MNRYSCDVIQDLLPLYEDGCCSKESGAIVEAHLAECPQCREALEEMRLPFSSVPSIADLTAEQTAKKGLRKLRKLWLRSLTGAAAILIAAFVLFIVIAVADGILNESYEVQHQSNCYFLKYDTENGYTITGQSTFSIVGRGESKRFSNEAGDFSGYMEVDAYPIPAEVIMNNVSCSINKHLVQLRSGSIQEFHPEVGYWYWVFISPEDPDICVIKIWFIDENKTMTAVCGDSEEDALENYQKYHDAFKAMTQK